MKNKSVIVSRFFNLEQGLPVRAGNRALSFCLRAEKGWPCSLFFEGGV